MAETLNAADKSLAEQSSLDEKWSRTVAGLDRAVAWIKRNQENLPGGFHIMRDHECDILISLGTDYGGGSAKRAEAIKRLFGGRTAIRKMRDNSEDFTIIDNELNIKFTWSIYRARDNNLEPVEIVI